MYGYTATEAVGSRSFELLGSKVSPEQRVAFVKRVEEGEVLRTEAELRRKDGSPVWSDVTATAKRNADGTLARFLSITRDITRAQASGRTVPPGGRGGTGRDDHGGPARITLSANSSLAGPAPRLSGSQSSCWCHCDSAPVTRTTADTFSRMRTSVPREEGAIYTRSGRTGRGPGRDWAESTRDG
jgi:hypothetical protein